MGTNLLQPCPRYTGKDLELRAWANDLCLHLENWSRSLGAPVGEQWIVNGTTAARDVDPTVITTIAGVVNALGTLVGDLSKGAPLSVT
jgi:hypothetical protein